MIALEAAAKVDGYIDDVLSGRIVVCKLVKKAVERHVRDLDRQRTEEFPYYFNERHAVAACEFFPALIKHSDGDFQGRAFRLEPWQAFGIWCLFGWKRVEDDSRRFRRYFWSMGRKNGKTFLAAGMALFCAMMDLNPVTGMPESVGEVILCAPKKEQVEKVIYAQILRIRESSNEIRDASSEINRQVSFFHNNSSIRCVGSDRPYSGLNPTMVIMDETHEWAPHNRRFYDTMVTGSISRSQPLIGSITTAGDDHSAIWKDEYSRACNVLNETWAEESFFAYVFEIDEGDNPLDESVWIKANPNIGISLKWDSLREQPKHTATDLNVFMRYHMNRPVSSTSRAFDIEQWDACKGELSDWSKADAIGYGVDLGSRDDLSAWAAVARFPIEGSVAVSDDDKTVWRYEVKAWAYMEAETNRNLNKPPFFQWCHDGLIKKEECPTIALERDLRRHLDDYDGIIAFDFNHARRTWEQFKAEGYKEATFSQNRANFNEPIRDFLQVVRTKRLTHDGNPVLRWCVGNAIVKDNEQEEIMFDKASSIDKIDMVVAAVMAFRVVSRAPARATGSMYV